MKYLILLLIISCNVETPVPPAGTVDAIYKWDNPQWDSWLNNEINRSGLLDLPMSDKEEFGIVDVTTMGRVFVEMAYWESKFDPAEAYHETFGLWSRGLFQLSYVDGGRYGCDFTDEISVHDPKANIQCAVRIAVKLVGQDGRFAGRIFGRWLGNSRYYAVLRGTRDYTARALEAIRNVNNL